MSKFVGKFRQRDHIMDDDEYDYSKNYIKNKKRKSESAELKKMRLRDYEDDNYGYDGSYSKKPKKYAKM